MAAAAISLDDFKSLTARQLRQECTSRGVSLTGCFDKDAMLQRLQKALSQAGGRLPERRPQATIKHTDSSLNPPVENVVSVSSAADDPRLYTSDDTARKAAEAAVPSTIMVEENVAPRQSAANDRPLDANAKEAAEESVQAAVPSKIMEEEEEKVVSQPSAADDRALHANDANAKEAAAVPSKIMEEEKEEKVVSQPSAADDRALHANGANAKEAAEESVQAAVPCKIMEEEEEKVVSQPSAAGDRPLHANDANAKEAAEESVQAAVPSKIMEEEEEKVVSQPSAAGDRPLHANDANAKEAAEESVQAAVPSKIVEEEKEEKVVSQPSVDTNANIEESEVCGKGVGKEDLIKDWIGEKSSLKNLPKWRVYSDKIEAAATQGLAINFSKLSDRSALEVIPMRALMKECKLLGIDVSGLYAKCEVIKKMVSEMNRIVVAGKEASFFVAHSPRTVDEGGKKPPIDVQAEFFLPEPLGPPVALSPFTELGEPPSPKSDPDPYHWLFGERVVEEASEQAKGSDTENEVEEIILEASPKAAPKEPREMSQPRVSTSASEGIGAVGTAQRRASISELFRLPLPELQIRCEAEGITVAAGDAKGLLISKLKQAMTRSVAPATAKESNDWTKAAKLEPPVAAPEAPDKVEPLEGPQVFHMASDDESLSAEHSDADFFPDFPAPPPAEEAGHIAETGPTSGDAAHVSPGAGESKSASESMDQAQASSEAEAFERTGSSSSIETDAVPVAPAEKTQAQGAESQSKQAPDAAEPQQAAAEPSSAATETTTTSTTADQALDDADAKDLDEGDMSSERDGGMFDFDDLDEAEVGSQLPTSGGLPMPSPDEPAGPVEKSPGLAEPVSQSQSVAPNENQSRSDKDPDASSEGSKNPLLKFTTKELLELARSRGVDVRGCVEKSDIVDRLTRAPRVPPSPAQQSRPAQQGVPPKPPMAKPPTRTSSFQASKPPPSAPAPKPAAKRPAKVARRPPANVMPDPGNQSAPPLRHPGEIPDGWSARVQTWFGRYPGFSAMLPPEAEMWTDQELDVYFGSNGDIWPRGKRPAWIGRPSTEPDPKPSARAPGPKTYPDLKVHFQTLDLAETTPPEIIRRHYRRLARDCHPDKHPDNVEEATRRFQQLTEAYEAIANRLKL